MYSLYFDGNIGEFPCLCQTIDSQKDERKRKQTMGNPNCNLYLLIQSHSDNDFTFFLSILVFLPHNK